jgi:hypothetical protein
MNTKKQTKLIETNADISGYDRNNSMRIWTSANQYFETYLILKNWHSDNGKNIPFSPVGTVPYANLLHSIELILKAFLRAKGESLSFLRKQMGHDLEKILDKCQEVGLHKLCSITSDEESSLILGNAYYKSKDLDYPETGSKYSLDLGNLESLAQSLLISLKQFCQESRKLNHS